MSENQQSKIYRDVAYYCGCFSQLNVRETKKQGTKLYQPILLLSVIDLVAEGVIKENHISISDELVETCQKYWDILGYGSFKERYFTQPFFHLQNTKCKFWHLQYTEKFKNRPLNISGLREAFDYASLDDELFDLLQEPDARKEMIDALISTWFSSSHQEIEKILKINQDFQDYTSTEIRETKILEKPPKFSIKKSLVRDAFFRKAVVHIYDYRCAFCRLKVTISLTQNIVDGAHIKPFAKFYDNRIDNGISFCKNHHWAFDRGLFTIGDNDKILVSSNFQEESPNAKPIREFNGKSIVLPKLELYFPCREALQWHRKNVFKS